MSEPVIHISDLTCTYGRAVILSGVSLTIGKGEICAIIGKSGCGKTTLLKNMLGLVDYQIGSVKLLGCEVCDREAVEKEGIFKRMGVLFQRGALLNSLPVVENAALPLEMHTKKKRSEIYAIAREKLEQVGMAHASHKLPSELSGGMLKRAALARAMALDPELLFCDEPSAGLDPVTTRSLDLLLLKIRKETGVSIVVVTHDIASIERIADRVVMLDKGTVAFNGSTAEARSAALPALKDFFS